MHFSKALYSTRFWADDDSYSGVLFLREEGDYIALIFSGVQALPEYQICRIVYQDYHAAIKDLEELG